MNDFFKKINNYDIIKLDFDNNKIIYIKNDIEVLQEANLNLINNKFLQRKGNNNGY